MKLLTHASSQASLACMITPSIAAEKLRAEIFHVTCGVFNVASGLIKILVWIGINNSQKLLLTKSCASGFTHMRQT